MIEAFDVILITVGGLVIDIGDLYYCDIILAARDTNITTTMQPDSLPSSVTQPTQEKLTTTTSPSPSLPVETARPAATTTTEENLSALQKISKYAATRLADSGRMLWGKRTARRTRKSG